MKIICKFALFFVKYWQISFFLGLSKCDKIVKTMWQTRHKTLSKMSQNIVQNVTKHCQKCEQKSKNVTKIWQFSQKSKHVTTFRISLSSPLSFLPSLFLITHTHSLIHLVSTNMTIHASDDTNVDERARAHTHTHVTFLCSFGVAIHQNSDKNIEQNHLRWDQYMIETSRDKWRDASSVKFAFYERWQRKRWKWWYET